MTIADVRLLFQWIRTHSKLSGVIGGTASLMAIIAGILAYFDAKADGKIKRTLGDLGPMSSLELQGRTNLSLATVERRLKVLREKGMLETTVKPHPTTGEVRRIWWIRFSSRS